MKGQRDAMWKPVSRFVESNEVKTESGRKSVLIRQKKNVGQDTEQYALFTNAAAIHRYWCIASN